MPAPILKIGQDEYAELWAQRGLGDHFKNAQLMRDVKDSFQDKPLGYVSLTTDHSLAQPISIGADGKLAGDVEGLCKRGLYKLGDEHYVHITPGVLRADELHYSLYKNEGDGIAKVAREYCSTDGEFEHKLADVIKTHGAITNTSELEVMKVADHLHNVRGTEMEQAVASVDLQTLLHHEKPKIPDGMGIRIRSAAEGTLDSPYTNIFVRKPGAKAAPTGEPPKIKVEPPPAPPPPAAPKPPIKPQAASEVSAFTKFWQNEKWTGKKGLAVAGATVAVGAIIYGVNKLLAKKKQPDERQWTERVSDQSNAQREL